MRSDALPGPTRKLLDKFSSSDLPSDTYLAGGTAIALQIGHRQSVDLDWFTSTEFKESQWQMKWETKWGFVLRTKDWQTLTGEISGVKTSLFHYKYPLIDDAKVYDGLEIASLKDLAAMKMDTITSRGTKRDFIDLYFLIKEFGPAKVFDFYSHKYGYLTERELTIRKALVYFGDAEQDEMPNMLAPINWEDVKTYFLKTFI